MNETMEYELADEGRPGVRHPDSNTHALVARTTRGPLVKLEEFPSYDDALVAHASASEHLDEYDLVDEYAVRATDDPAIEHRFGQRNPDRYFHRGRTLAALREAHRKEVGATAATKVRAAWEGKGLGSVVRETQESLRARGFKTTRHEVEAAVKSRVLLGRCHNHGRAKRGFWVKKSDGPLYRLACPNCGRRLSQTSLALDAEFYRLVPKEKEEK